MPLVPGVAQVADATVQVAIDTGGGVVQVTVLFMRRPGPPIDGASVLVDAIDRSGRPMPLLERPGGQLVEVGGSMATTATAVFAFAGDETPGEVTVHWGTDAARFLLDGE